MTLFEQVLSYEPELIASISREPSSPDEQFIVQALVAMGDDELGPDEMRVRVTRKSWHHEWAQAGSVYKVRKETIHSGHVYKLSGNNDLGLWADACEVIQ